MRRSALSPERGKNAEHGAVTATVQHKVCERWSWEVAKSRQQ